MIATQGRHHAFERVAQGEPLRVQPPRSKFRAAITLTPHGIEVLEQQVGTHARETVADAVLRIKRWSHHEVARVFLGNRKAAAHGGAYPGGEPLLRCAVLVVKLRQEVRGGATLNTHSEVRLGLLGCFHGHRAVDCTGSINTKFAVQPKHAPGASVHGAVKVLDRQQPLVSLPRGEDHPIM